MVAVLEGEGVGGSRLSGEQRGSDAVVVVVVYCLYAHVRCCGVVWCVVVALCGALVFAWLRWPGSALAASAILMSMLISTLLLDLTWIQHQQWSTSVLQVHQLLVLESSQMLF